MKITAGAIQAATAKSVRTIFSPSPIHLEVREEAEMEKKVARMLEATALPSSVLPVPGGPKRRMPLGGARAPCAAGVRARWDSDSEAMQCAVGQAAAAARESHREDVGVEHGPDDHLLDQSLGGCLPRDVVPGDGAARVHDLVAHLQREVWGG